MTLLASRNFPNRHDGHPETRGPALVLVNGIFLPLTVLFVALRIYTRAHIKRWIGYDDILLLVATLLAIGLTAVVVQANVHHTWDRHIQDIPREHIPDMKKAVMAANALFVATTFFTRCSFLSFYYRLAIGRNLKGFAWVLRSSMATNLIAFLVVFCLVVFQCRPIDAFWMFKGYGKCLDEGMVALAVAIVNCILDLLVTILPIPLIMRMQISARQRWGLNILLSLGLVVTMASVTRTYYIWMSLIKSYDEPWYAYPVWIAAAIEVDLAIMVACCPSLQSLLRLRPWATIQPFSRNQTPPIDNRGTGSATPSGHSQNWTDLSSLDEKKNDITMREFEIVKPKRSLSKIEGQKPQRLTILYRQSFEVLSEERKNSASDEEANIGLTFANFDGEYVNRPSDRRSGMVFSNEQSDAGLSITSTILQVAPLSPLAYSESEYLSEDAIAKSARTRPSTVGASTFDFEAFESPTMRSFWMSDDSDLSPGIKEPLPFFKHVDAKPEIVDVTRRWDIEKNPFRESQKVWVVGDADDSTSGVGKWQLHHRNDDIELKGVAKARSFNHGRSVWDSGKISRML